MFRTRDFVLFFTAITFLVMAIGVTVFTQNKNQPPQITTDIPYVAEVDVLGGEVGEREISTLTRAERLVRMQEKIAESELVITADIPSIEPDDVLDEQVVSQTLVLCPGYQPNVSPIWSPSSMQMVEAEGVRQYGVVQTNASGTESISVQLQLPVLFVPLGNPSCIASDVIGVALDNSLIRNSETALYGVFGQETLIGYALDGFPIYGTGESEVDACGGRIALGQYRYELSKDRETIINCFSGAPESL